MLFKNLPKIVYNGYLIPDISVRYKIRDYIKNNISAYEFYDFVDTDSLETIAFNFYGDTNLNWLVALMNDIIDPFYDLPLTSNEFRIFIKEKYDNPEAIKHYIDDEGYIVANTGNETPISYEQYESKLNDNKRKIKILGRTHINQVLRELQELLYE